MIEEDSAGFVEAFTAAVRPHEKRSRPLRWMLLVGFGVAFAAALGSLLNGAFGSGSSSSGSGGSTSSLLGATAPATVPITGVATVPFITGTATATATASAKAKAATWTGVAGPGCTGSGASFTTAGFSTGDASSATDWVLSTTGGYDGDSCSGGYVSMPVSGSASALDANRYALWTFTLGNGLTSASCKLTTYVPDSSSAALVGGAPAYYYYYGSVYSAATSPTPLGNYAVNQPNDPGRWVSAGSAFSVTSGKVSVRMVDAGVELGSGTSGIVRDAAAQVRLTCTAS